MSTSTIPCTVAILTKDSASTLERVLESVKGFSDIIVCDGGSTDETSRIAYAFGARVIRQDARFLDAESRIADFAGVRNQTLHAARERWFFFLDSDEEASPELVSRIREIATDSKIAAYWIARLYEYRGVRITCSASYPNRQIRFFHREGVTGFRKRVHERVAISPETPIRALSEAILVPVSEDQEILAAKTERYLRMEVERLAGIGPAALRRGVFDGAKSVLSWIARFAHSALFCHGTWLPLSYEFRSVRYQVALVRMLLARLFNI